MGATPGTTYHLRKSQASAARKITLSERHQIAQERVLAMARKVASQPFEQQDRLYHIALVQRFVELDQVERAIERSSNASVRKRLRQSATMTRRRQALSPARREIQVMGKAIDVCRECGFAVGHKPSCATGRVVE